MRANELLKENMKLMSELNEGEKRFFTRLVETVLPIRDIGFAMDALKQNDLKTSTMTQLYETSKPLADCRNDKDEYFTAVQQYCTLGITKEQFTRETVKDVFKETAVFLACACNEPNDDKFLLYLMLVFERAKKLC